MRGKAVVLLSGGMDSTTTLAIAKKEGFEIYALSFDYGQRNSLEIKKAEKIAVFFGARDHLVIPVHLKKIGGSSLTSDGISLPRGRDFAEIGERNSFDVCPGQEYHISFIRACLGRSSGSWGHFYWG